jgi:hypothetical protein
VSQDRRFRNSSRVLEAGDLALSTSGLKPRGRRAGNAVNTIHCTGLIGAALKDFPSPGPMGGTGLGEGNYMAVHVTARANRDGLRHHGAGTKTPQGFRVPVPVTGCVPRANASPPAPLLGSGQCCMAERSDLAGLGQATPNRDERARLASSQSRKARRRRSPNLSALTASQGI